MKRSYNADSKINQNNTIIDKNNEDLVEDEFGIKRPNGTFLMGFGQRPNSVNRRKGKSVIKRWSRAASSIKNIRTLLDRDQLLDCADVYINNGIVRAVVDKSVWFTLGERTRFIVEPNQELLEGATDQEVRKLFEAVKNDKPLRQSTDTQGSSAELRIKDLIRNLVRVNKRVELHDRLTKWDTNIEVFGRAFLQIKRFEKKTGWNKFGEPEALYLLNPTRIKDIDVDDQTTEFKGLWYDYGVPDRDNIKVKSTELISGWHDDNNVFENTYYSGASPIWTVLSVAQAIEVILDENIPEATKVGGKFSLIYTGTNKKQVADDIRNELEQYTHLVHNYPGLKAEVHDLARDPNEQPDVINKLAKYICQSLNLPLFLLFEDTANFATANQTMQVYKVSTLNRYRTWLQGILEKYWYDPMLADHLNIELEDVISADIKIKPVFEDISFETRLETITGCGQLQAMGVYRPVDSAKKLDEDEIVNRLELEAKAESKELETDLQKKQQELNNAQNQNQQGGFNQNGQEEKKETDKETE